MSAQVRGRGGSGGSEDPINKPADSETQPLLRRTSVASESSHGATKQLTTRHAFAILVTIQIGSGIFASPASVDSHVPSPGAALLVWVLGGLLSWAGAASFAELGAAIPLNGGMQAYLAYIFGPTMSFLMAWIYIFAAKPSAMAIQSIVIADSIGSIMSDAPAAWLLKLFAALIFAAMVLVNSINTKITLRLSESFTGLKLLTVSMIVLGGFVAIVAHLINPRSSLSGSEDWYSKDWFATRPTFYEGQIIDWTSISTWERYGHYSAALYGGLWAYDGWDNVSLIYCTSFKPLIQLATALYTRGQLNIQNLAQYYIRVPRTALCIEANLSKANVVASEIRNPGQALPKAIKAAMVVVLGSYELVNLAYYVLLPWATVSSTDAVAVVAIGSAFGRWAGIIVSILVAVSCAGSITSNVFTIGRLTVAAAESNYLPAVMGQKGLPWVLEHSQSEPGDAHNEAALESHFDMPM